MARGIHTDSLSECDAYYCATKYFTIAKSSISTFFHEDFKSTFRLKVQNGIKLHGTYSISNTKQHVINLYNAEIFLYNSWGQKGYFKFEVIINVFVSSF